MLPTRFRVRKFGWRLAAVGALVLAGGIGAAAQFEFWAGPEPAVHNIPYDGRFTFARVKYRTPPPGYYYHNLPAWAHGYPTAERNLMQILNDISFIAPHVEEDNVFTLDDPALLRFPVAYMTEAGFWTMSEKEAAGFRAYLEKGGFAIFDDFRGGPRGGGGWENFEANMRRVLPDLKIVDITPRHAIFHSFFEIESFQIIPQYYDLDRPVFKGIYEDNDPGKRLMVMVNFNTDVSNFWEFSATGLRPIDESNQAYKLGVNYIVYGLTH
jgi:hypothetical protein